MVTLTVTLMAEPRWWFWIACSVVTLMAMVGLPTDGAARVLVRHGIRVVAE